MLARYPGTRAVAGLTALALVGCVTWSPIRLTPSAADLRGLPFVVRVTQTDSTRLTLLSPFLRADTVYGRVARDTVGIPLSAIGHAEQERFHPVTTVALVLAAPILLLGTLYFIGCGLSGHRCADSVS